MIQFLSFKLNAFMLSFLSFNLKLYIFRQKVLLQTLLSWLQNPLVAMRPLSLLPLLPYCDEAEMLTVCKKTALILLITLSVVNNNLADKQ